MLETTEPNDKEKKVRRLKNGGHFLNWQEIEVGLCPFDIPASPVADALEEKISTTISIRELAKLIADDINRVNNP